MRSLASPMKHALALSFRAPLGMTMHCSEKCGRGRRQHQHQGNDLHYPPPPPAFNTLEVVIPSEVLK